MIVRNKKEKRFKVMQALIKIADAIVPLLTLGYYWTDLEYTFVKKHLFKY